MGKPRGNHLLINYHDNDQLFVDDTQIQQIGFGASFATFTQNDSLIAHKVHINHMRRDLQVKTLLPVSPSDFSVWCVLRWRQKIYDGHHVTPSEL